MSRIQPNMLCLIINAPAGTDAEKRPTVTTIRVVASLEFMPEAQSFAPAYSGKMWLCGRDDGSTICIPEPNLMPIGGLKELEQQEQEVFA